MRYAVGYKNGTEFAQFVRRQDAEEFIEKVLAFEVEQGIKFEIVEL